MGDLLTSACLVCKCRELTSCLFLLNKSTRDFNSYGESHQSDCLGLRNGLEWSAGDKGSGCLWQNTQGNVNEVTSH